jgi:predicted O-linked N-acetylglucosamine transferase (SPINDLY family)
MTKLMNSRKQDLLNQAKELFLLGMKSYQEELYEEAEELLSASLYIQPERLSTLINLFFVLIELEKYNKASEVICKAIEIHSNDETLYICEGHLFEKKKQLKKAISSYEKALEIKSDCLEAEEKRKIVLKEIDRSDEAMCAGTSAAQKGEYDQAIALLSKAIEIDADNFYAHNNLGNVLKELKNFNDALISYEKAIEIKFDYAEAYYNRGIVQNEIKKLDESVESYRQAIKYMPTYEKAYSNLGNVLQKLNRFEEALICYDKAIELNENFGEAYSNRGTVLKELKRLEEALTSFEKAIYINSELPEAYSNLGIILQELNRLEESRANFDKAIKLRPKFAEAYANRGEVLTALNLIDLAFQSFDKAMELEPSYEYLEGKKLHTKMLMCDWHNYHTELNNLIIRINKEEKSTPVFPMLGLTDSLLVLCKSSEIWIKDKHKINHKLGPITKPRRKDKIKIGYYSADFREHPVSYLAAELFELHDKSKFELIGFYYGPQDSSIMHKRIISSFDNFIYVRNTLDSEVAQISRKLEIDIAVDLTGITQYSRVGIFSCRAAPIQISYLGFLGTMGAEYYDYLIADRVIIPIESQQYYKEKIVYLPSYQINDSKRKIADKIFTREELNLPKKGFVFCCLNNNFKITPTVFDGWMRILKKVTESVLYLYAENKWVELNLKNEAERRGICKSRLKFATRISRNEYLARYSCADLFLDTLPYNAGTTASDALWAGLPVLTCIGDSFASRIAASLLSAIELPELITRTQAEYEAEAIELATNPEKLKNIKIKLDKNRSTTALFNSKDFTLNIEDAYTKIYERFQKNLRPEHIFINAKK